MRAGYGELALFYRAGGTPFGLQALAPWEGKEVYVYVMHSLGRRPLFDRRIIVHVRAQYVTLRMHGEHVGVLNVYAPNHASARADFWS